MFPKFIKTFTKVICGDGFWVDVLKLAGIFILIYNSVDIWLNYSFDLSLYADAKFQSDKLLRFFVANILSGFVYGFIVSFFKFRNRIKKKIQVNKIRLIIINSKIFLRPFNYPDQKVNLIDG